MGHQLFPQCNGSLSTNSNAFTQHVNSKVGTYDSEDDAEDVFSSINFQPEECGDYSGVKGCSREHRKMLETIGAPFAAHFFA